MMQETAENRCPLSIVQQVWNQQTGEYEESQEEWWAQFSGDFLPEIP